MREISSSSLILLIRRRCGASEEWVPLLEKASSLGFFSEGAHDDLSEL